MSTRFLCRPYVVYRWLKASNCSKPQSNVVNILVWSSYPGIGDSFLSLDALYSISKIVKEIPNATLHVRCNGTLVKLLEAIGEDFGCKDYIKENSNEYYSRLKKLKIDTEVFSKEFWDYIVFLEPPSQYQKSLVATMCYGQVLFPRSKTTPSKITEGLFYEKLMHNVTVIQAKNDINKYEHYLVTTRRIVEAFGEMVCASCDEHKMYDRYSVVCSSDSFEDVRDYCVVAVGYDKNNPHNYRGWPLERYAEVCKWIVKSLKLKVVLTGTVEDLESCKEVKELVGKNESSVINLSGKLSLSGWLKVVKNAKFILGNDSGIIHAAVKLNVSSFVICGYWEYGKHLPYPDEFIGCLPELLISAEPNCELCYAKYYDQEKNCKECEECVKKYGVYKCIMDVSVQDVKDRISEIL